MGHDDSPCMTRHGDSNRGFTLLESLIVVSIAAIVTAVAVPNVVVTH
jgi:prepilin-type N-terminal cleavage/methylation domain-containing protein